MRFIAWTILVVLFLPSLAVADLPVPEMADREIILPKKKEVDRVNTSAILKNLTGRFWLEYREDRQGRRSKVRLKIRLWEFPRGSDGVVQKLDVKPQLGDEMGLTFIYRF